MNNMESKQEAKVGHDGLEAEVEELAADELELATGGASSALDAARSNIKSYVQNQVSMTARYVMMMYPAATLGRR